MSGGVHLEKSDFSSFMRNMLQALESLLKAPSGSFLFAECSQIEERSHFGFFREFNQYGITYCIGVRADLLAQCGEYRFLLNLAVKEVYDLVSDGEMFRRSASTVSGKWAYDYSVHDWHEPETLAHQVHELISH